MKSKGGAALLLVLAILLIWLANSGKLQLVWSDLFGGKTTSKQNSGANAQDNAGTSGGQVPQG